MTVLTTPAFTLPAAASAQLIQWRGAGDDERWATGDLVNSLIAEYTPYGITREAIYAACAPDRGVTAGSIRRYAETAAAFGIAVRAVFQPPLTYAYFQALRYCEGPSVWLAWCIESADDYGGLPAPLDVLLVQLATGSPTAPRPPRPATLPIWRASDPAAAAYLLAHPDALVVLVDDLDGLGSAGAPGRVRVRVVR